MSKNVVTFPSAQTSKIGVAVVSSKRNAFVSFAFFSVSLISFAIVKEVSFLVLLTSSNLDCRPQFFQSKYCITIGKSLVDL